MPLEPTEREEHFFNAMVDAAGGSTTEELEPTERKEHWYKEIIEAIKSGGGGSGGDSNIFIVNATFAYDDVNDEWSVTLDKTFAEISAASNADKIVLCIPYESVMGITGYPCVMTVETAEAYASTDVDLGDANGTVHSFGFGIESSNDDTYVDARTWSKGGGGVLVVGMTFDDLTGTATLDKTWQEIYDAKCGIIACEIDGDRNSMQIIRIGEEEGTFHVGAVSFLSNEMEIIEFRASSASGYPSDAEQSPGLGPISEG